MDMKSINLKFKKMKDFIRNQKLISIPIFLSLFITVVLAKSTRETPFSLAHPHFKTAFMSAIDNFSSI
jgi:hypothetical protein